MKRLFVFGIAIASLVPGFASAQSLFNGTWSLVPRSIHLSHSKPMVLSLKNGIFYGTQDGTPIKLPADGKDHAVKGTSGFNTVSIHVINGHSFKEVDKQNGKVVVTALVTASPDGQTLTVNLRKADGSNSTQISRRIATGAPGSNAVSGTWQFERLSAASGGEFQITYKVTGKTVESSNPEGSFTATLGGKPVPYVGSGIPNITVSAQMPSKNVLRETFYAAGTEVSTSTFTIQPGGRTMENVSQGGKGKPSTVVYRKVQ